MPVEVADGIPQRPRDSSRLSWAVLLSITGALAAAAYVRGASIFLVEWGSRSGSRVAVLPVDVRPVMLTLAVGFAVAAVGFAWRVVLRRPLGELAATLSPLQLLWLWTLPYLPWLADQFPWLLVLAAPARLPLAGLAVTLVVVNIVRRRRRRHPAGVEVGPRTVFVVSLLLFVAVGTYVGREQGLGGDEPHYLIITHSLLTDGDLQIENNHARHDEERFSRVPLPPHFLHRGRGGVIYSVHAPGLPALLVPAYALGGARGAVLCISVIAALGASAIFLLARAVAGPRLALVTTAGTTLSIPFFLHAWLIFPEMPAAAIDGWAAWWLWQRTSTETAWRWTWRGALLALLPWLHVKFAVLLVGLCVALVIKLLAERRFASVAALLAPVVVALTGWLWFFYLLYGVFDPTIPYGGLGAQADQLGSSNVPRGMLGLLLDQEWGLLIYAPWYVLAVLGLAPLARTSGTRWRAVALAGTALAFVISATQYYMWWGGWSVPARFLVPVLPFAVPFLAAALAAPRSAAARGVATLLVCSSVAVTGVLVARPDLYLMYNDRDGSGKLVEMLGGIPLVESLPSLLWQNWKAQLPHVVFVAGTAMVAASTVWLIGRRRGATMMQGIGGVVVAGILGGAVMARATQSPQEVDATVREGRLGLLTLFDQRERLVDPTRLRTVSPAGLFRRLDVQLLPPADGVEDAITAIGPVTLPPGRYDVAVWLQEGQPVTGSILTTWHPGRAVLARADGALQTPVGLTLDLPAAVDGTPVWVGSDSLDTARLIRRVDILPREVVPREKRNGVRPLKIDGIGQRVGAALVYQDEESFAEGGVFWTRGETRSRVLVLPGGATVLRVRVQSGAAAGDLDLKVGPSRRQLRLPPWQTQIGAELRLAPGTEVVPIEVGFSAGFRPSDVEPNSHDRRWLGCRVYVDLE